mgnify:CR=1 FL=1
MWELPSGKALKTLSGHSNDVLGLAYSADGATLVTASADGTLRVWTMK